MNRRPVGTRYSNKQLYLRQTASCLSFIFFSIYVGLGTKSVDGIYATSTPLTVGIPAVVLKWLKRKAFVFEVAVRWAAGRRRMASSNKGQNRDAGAGQARSFQR